MSLGKQILTLVIAALLLGLGTRVVTKNTTPLWGFPEPIKLISPPESIADPNTTKPDSMFAKADQPYEVNLATTMVLYMKRSKNNVHFVDAREAKLYEEGHIPGAINIPYEHLDENTEKFLALPKDDLIVLYCDGGDCHLSHDLAEWALANDYGRLAVFTGGWAEWSAESDMIATGAEN
ncbi:MAG: rhodanese-like domain-containing protein [Calditrichaeota bacterium]|nr:rhodanese-like domain-containing protein [Calditrichota bacterium]